MMKSIQKIEELLKAIHEDQEGKNCSRSFVSKPA